MKSYVDADLMIRGEERLKAEIAAVLGRRVAPAIGGRSAGGGGHDGKQQELSL